MTAGYITMAYDGNKRDFNSKPNRGFVHPIDAESGKLLTSKYVRSDTVNPAKPGKYRAVAASSIGYFDPVDFHVEHGKPITVTFIAKPTADVSMTYAPGDYEHEPDRATLVPLDGQKPIKTYMSLSNVLKVPPGRYRIDPSSYAVGVKPLEFTLAARETKSVVLK